MLSTSLDYWWTTVSWFVHFGQFSVKCIIISCKSSCKKIMQPLIEIHRQHIFFNLHRSFSLRTHFTFEFFICIKEWHINKHLFLMLFSSFPSSPWKVSTLCKVLVDWHIFWKGMNPSQLSPCSVYWKFPSQEVSLHEPTKSRMKPKPFPRKKNLEPKTIS